MQEFLLNFAVVPVFITAVIGVVRFRQFNRVQRYLVGLTLCALLMEVCGHILAHYKRPNLFLAPIDTTLEFGFLALIYQRVLRPGVASRFIPVVALAFVLGSALTFSPRLDTVQFSPVQHFLESVLVLGFVLLFFYREINRKVIAVRLEREPMFWISTGLLLYFSGNALIFLSSNYVLNHSRATSMSVWAIHAVLYMLLNVFYALALCLRPPRPETALPASGITQT